jgi:CHASE2 domain-containing sensor protein
MLVASFGFYLTKKHLKYTPRINNLGGMFISGLAMATFLFFFQGWNLFLAAPASAIVYFASLYLTKSISQEEIKSLFNRDKVQIEEVFPEEPIG